MLKIKESVIGYFVYHLAEENKYKALCGSNVMNTSLRLDQWGVVTEHIGEKYCEDCLSIAKKNGGNYMKELDTEHNKDQKVKNKINELRAKI